MTAQAQRMLAIAGALLGVGVFLVANAHFLKVAMQSQPACIASDRAAPAKPAC